jgi:hypothetical protein
MKNHALVKKKFIAELARFNRKRSKKHKEQKGRARKTRRKQQRKEPHTSASCWNATNEARAQDQKKSKQDKLDRKANLKQAKKRSLKSGKRKGKATMAEWLNEQIYLDRQTLMETKPAGS